MGQRAKLGTRAVSKTMTCSFKHMSALIKSWLFPLLLLGSLWQASICRAQDSLTTSNWSGCQVQARAYVDPTVWAASRFDMQVLNPAGSPLQWDFTLDWEHFTTPVHYTSIGSAQPRLPYGKAKYTIIHATLRQSRTLEERVTFHNLDLCPLADDWETQGGNTPRFLVLKSPLTAATPSGVQITLPAQNVQHFHEMFSGYNGPISYLFIKIETTPNQLEAVLPLSPLYQQYKKTVHIEIGCDEAGTVSFGGADNTSKIVSVDLPNLRTVTHLDSLTLVVRQRVILKQVPIALRLPISRPSQAAKAFGH